jgi:hypothetical protein
VRLAATVLILAFAPLAAAAPPRAGVFDPGRSLGGLRLGMTPRQVEAAWGTNHGHCRNCPFPTWYYNYARFTPKGAGVEFKRGRVSAVFTLSSPEGWRTTRGLRLGDPAARVTAVYGAMTRTECGSYYALLLPHGRTVSAFYVAGERLWAFALLRIPSPPCR